MLDIVNSLFGFPLGWIMWLCYALFCSAMNLPGGYLIALILFTLITKVILFPMQIKQQKTQVKSAYYQPQIAAIQKKYAGNREKMQEEIMKFQQKEKIGMTAGCLPMVLQFGFLFGVIDVVYKPLTHILHLDYFWQTDSLIDKAVAAAQNLNIVGGKATAYFQQGYYQQLDLIHKLQGYVANPAAADAPLKAAAEVLQNGGALDDVVKFGNNMNFLGIDMGATPWQGFPNTAQFEWSWLLLIPVLAGVAALLTTILTQKLNPVASQTADQPGGGCMKVFMYLMPLISLFFAMTVPAGVGVYWIISNLAALGSTVILRKMYNPEKYREQLAVEQAARKEAEKKKNTIIIEQTKTTEDGEAVKETVEVTLSRKEAERRAIAEARRRMAEKYGETMPEDETDDSSDQKKK